MRLVKKILEAPKIVRHSLMERIQEFSNKWSHNPFSPRGPATSLVWRTRWGNYHPRSIWRRCSNLNWTRGFVKMSALLESVGTLTICRDPLITWSLKWWYFNAICFVRGLKLELVVARTIHAALSSNIWDGSRVEPLILSWGEVLGREIKLCVSMSKRSWRRGKSSRAAELRAMYSLSVADKAISVWRRLAQVTGHPPKKRTCPVWERTLSGRCVCSLCHIPAKSESTYISKARLVDRCMMMPFDFVACRYRKIPFTASSWMTRGLMQKHAHWWTAILMSGLELSAM